MRVGSKTEVITCCLLLCFDRKWTYRLSPGIAHHSAEFEDNREIKIFSSLFTGSLIPSWGSSKGHWQNSAKFGQDIEQSSNRMKLALDFRYLRLFREEGCSKSSVVEICGQMSHFLITCKIMRWMDGDVSVLLSTGAYDRPSGMQLMGGCCAVWLCKGPVKNNNGQHEIL